MDISLWISVHALADEWEDNRLASESLHCSSEPEQRSAMAAAAAVPRTQRRDGRFPSIAEQRRLTDGAFGDERSGGGSLCLILPLESPALAASRRRLRETNGIAESAVGAEVAMADAARVERCTYGIALGHLPRVSSGSGDGSRSRNKPQPLPPVAEDVSSPSGEQKRVGRVSRKG